MKKIILFLGLLFPAIGFAQQYTINWHKVAGGGGTSTNGSFQVSGTIGQPDASGLMAGGNYSVTGGFWSLISTVQMADVPSLKIVQNGPNSVIILWPDTGNYTLQQNGNLATTNWVTSSYSITTTNGTISVTITPPVGNLFFRLRQ
jgi:hypothetical protein